MEPLQFHFVEANKPNQTERTKELVMSTIRSHNAKVIHAKRNLGTKLSDPVARQPGSIKPLTSRFRIAPRGVHEDIKAAEHDKASVRDHSLVCKEGDAAQSREWLNDLLYRQWKESIRTPFSGNVPKHIAIYQQMIVPTIQLAFEVFHVRNTHNYEFLQWMTKPTTSGYHAGAAGLQLLYDMQVSPGCGQTRKCLFHKGKAFGILRQTISQSPNRVSDDELLAILSLATVERTVDIEAHRYHLEILAKIIEAQGGLNTVADHPRCTILQFDSWWSLSTSLRFFSNPQSFPQPVAGNNTISTRFRDQIHQIPTGFHAFILDGTLSASIVEVIIRLAFVYRRTNLKRDASGHIIGLPYTARPVFSTFHEACPALDVPGPSKEKFLAMAIVLYCGIGFDSAPISSNGGLAARAELSKVLKQYARESDSQEEKRVLFWIWMVTICAWHSASGNRLLPPGVELLRKLRREFRNVKGWKDAEEILETFFWNKDLSGLSMAEFERVGPF